MTRVRTKCLNRKAFISGIICSNKLENRFENNAFQICMSSFTMDMSVYLHTNIPVHITEHLYGGQRTADRSWFSPFTIWVSGIELKSLMMGSKSLYPLSHLTCLRVGLQQRKCTHLSITRSWYVNNIWLHSSKKILELSLTLMTLCEDGQEQAWIFPKVNVVFHVDADNKLPKRCVQKLHRDAGDSRRNSVSRCAKTSNVGFNTECCYYPAACVCVDMKNTASSMVLTLPRRVLGERLMKAKSSLSRIP